MKIPKYIPGPVDYWVGEAITMFVNGFIAGLGGGSVVGVGLGATTATTDLGASLPPVKQVMIAVSSLLLSAVGNGLKRVIVWHHQNPFPNPWPKPETPTMEERARAIEANQISHE